MRIGRLSGGHRPIPPGLVSHPRSAGSYARTLRRLVRGRGLLTLTEALRRSSLLPAQLLAEAVPAMRRKGRVQVGADADLVVFDPATVTDRATFANPHQLSIGIDHVLTSGVEVFAAGAAVQQAGPQQPGRALRFKS